MKVVFLAHSNVGVNLHADCIGFGGTAGFAQEPDKLFGDVSRRKCLVYRKLGFKSKG